jgi:predicted phosphodiesterase
MNLPETVVMKFAAIADVHGNASALEAVLADIAAQGFSDADVVNLGDHVTGPLDAARSADLLMERSFVTIRGDQDRRLVELARQGGKRMDLDTLSARHVEWLADQPRSLLWRGEIFLCHGSPTDDARMWLDHVTETGQIVTSPVEAIESDLTKGMSQRATLILCAHTHIPRVLRLRDGRLVVNPGSVGLPGYNGTEPVPHKVETGTPDACYAIIEKARGGWRASLRWVPYDHNAMAQTARSRGATSWASALSTGWIR